MADTAPSSVPTPTPATESTLERNLRAIARTSADLVKLIRETEPRADVVWAASDENVPTAAFGVPPVQLASRRRPLEEGAKLAATVDLAQAATVVVLGFGLGYHVAAMAKRMLRRGLILVFEPDIGLLRCVLERVDVSEAFVSSNIAIYHDPVDGARLASTLTGVEGVVAVGAKILVHPPSRGRLGVAAETFGQTFADVLKAVRTNVVTTLLQVDVTLRNLFQNIDRYVTVPGIRELKNVARGRAAVVVSAGPSLERNIAELARPGVRDRVVVIATQTVLKTLLRRGIKPHFVTALDYHEISARFYEGLTEKDVEGVTLVAEPKANPAILDAFPGTILCTRDAVLDELLGRGLRRDHGQLPPGSTVAHLCYYLARHLGCDPVILAGQDLGFTDGQYYSSGASIHDVWAGELSEFNTLEMLEWQRIARFGRLLRRRTDTLGRSIYTDEQMSTYLVQFEREFAAAVKQGLRVIDATEGGVIKAHAEQSTLRAAIDEAVKCEPLRLPRSEKAPFTAGPRKEVARRRLQEIREGVTTLADLCSRTRDRLEEMLGKLGDQAAVNRLIADVYTLRTRAIELGPAHWVVQYLNQTGTLNRFRADRTLHMDEGITPAERQKRQIERDLVNVRWLRDAALHMESMLADAASTLAGGPRVTRDPPPSTQTLESLRAEFPDLAVPDTRRRRVGVCMTFDARQGGLGPRDLSRPLIGGDNPLRCTLRRLARLREADEIVLIATDAAQARALAGDALLPGQGPPVRIVETDGEVVRDRLRVVAAARLWSRTCWRGGIANLTAWDEAFVPAAVAPVAEELGLDAVAVVGADWAFIDPDTVDAVIARYRERPESYKVAFAPAPAGLGCCIMARQIVNDLATQAVAAGAFASVGGLLGYIPIQPQLDPLGRPMCVQVPPEVRDLEFRLIPDSEHERQFMARIAAAIGVRIWHASATEIARAARDVAGSLPSLPAIIRIGVASGSAGGPMSPARFARWMQEVASWPNRVAVSIEGDPTEAPAPGLDALSNPCWREMVGAALSAGAPVHVRTMLPPESVAELGSCGASVVSVDLFSDMPETYETLTGLSDYKERTDAVRSLVSARRLGAGGLAVPWVVPRITRRDAVYEEIESFYARWIMEAGAAVIDPLREPIPGERIAPIALPASARSRLAAAELVIAADGSAFARDEASGAMSRLGSALDRGLAELWSRGHPVEDEADTPVLRVIASAPGEPTSFSKAV